MSDIVNIKEWRKRHKIKGFKERKGFIWRRWNPAAEDIPHQRPPKPHIVKVNQSDIDKPEENSSASCSSLGSVEEPDTTDPEDTFLARVETIITETGDNVPHFPHIPVTDIGHERDSHGESVNTAAAMNSNVNGKIVTSQ